jgi:hypothetical protein
MTVVVYDVFKCCPSLHEIVGVHIPARNFRDFSLFREPANHPHREPD